LPVAPADRQKAYIDRKRRGGRIAHVPIDEVGTALKLIDVGLLSKDDSDDNRKVDAALSLAIADWIRE
jgi:hypothetical protein